MEPLLKFEIKNKTLLPWEFEQGYVLNGIAYDLNRDIFLVTGKKWGYFYEIEFD